MHAIHCVGILIYVVSSPPLPLGHCFFIFCFSNEEFQKLGQEEGIKIKIRKCYFRVENVAKQMLLHDRLPKYADLMFTNDPRLYHKQMSMSILVNFVSISSKKSGK